MDVTRATVAPPPQHRAVWPLTVAVLALALTVTGIAGWATRRDVHDLRRRRFEARMVEARTDIYSDPVRRSAVEEARDSGDLVATAPVELLSGGGRGFVLYLAVYDTRSLPVTAPARRRHFRGTVTAVFRAQALLEHILDTAPGLELDIYDVGLTVDPARRTP